MHETVLTDAPRGRGWLLAVAGALLVVGLVAAVSWSDDTEPQRQATTARATTTSTTLPTEVMGAQVDNTTTSAAPSAATTTTTVAGSTAAATTTTTAAAGSSGRIYGYSWPSEPNDETTVSLMRDGAVVAERKTDGDGYFEFRDLPAGTYNLFRTTTTHACPTSTTSGPQVGCASTSSRSDSETQVTIDRGGEARADVF